MADTKTEKTRPSWAAVTMQDVADHAKVSLMTVSRVLNNQPIVKPATREKVLKAAKELNYKPNFTARSLAKARSFFIGLLYNKPTEDHPIAGYISEFIDGAVRRCRADRYHLLLENCGPTREDWSRDVGDMLGRSNVDGLVILPPICDYEFVIDAVKELNVPYVRVSPDTEPEISASVGVNDYDAAYRMTRHLIDLGHSEIGFIKGLHFLSASRERFEGFQVAMREAGHTVNPAWVMDGDFSYKSGLAAAERLLVQEHRPTAIFASNDDMAAAVVAMTRKYHLDIPDDLSVVGFDDTTLATTTWPALTTVRQPISKIAESAVSIILRQLSDDVSSRKMANQWLLDCPIIERESSGPPPANARKAQ